MYFFMYFEPDLPLFPVYPLGILGINCLFCIQSDWLSHYNHDKQPSKWRGIFFCVCCFATL